MAGVVKRVANPGSISLEEGEEVAAGFDDAGGDFGEGEGVGFDFFVSGFLVEGDAVVEEGADGVLGVVIVEEGAVAVAGGAAEDFLGGDDEPDDVAELAEEEAVFGAFDDAAAGGDDLALLFFVEEGLEDGAFVVAEGGFALGGEDFGDGVAGALDDEVVGIDEGVVEDVGEFAADGGLAGAHEANEDNVLGGHFVHLRETLNSFSRGGSNLLLPGCGNTG